MPKHNPTSGEAWQGRVETCRQMRMDLMKTWQDSVAYRRGKPFRTAPSEDTINVPADWSRTKNKQAKLFYQVPQVKLRARRPEYIGATAVFAAALNFELTTRVKAEHVMNECLSDVINAAGIAICKVGYEATFEEKEVGPEAFGQPPIPQAPGMTPSLGTNAPAMGMGAPMPAPPPPPGPPGQLPAPPVPPPDGVEPPQVAPGMAAPEPQAAPEAAPPDIAGLLAGVPEKVSVPVYECYYARRISPAHFLWPVEFTGSNWDEAPWIGWEGVIPLAEAQRREWVDANFEGMSQMDPDWFLVRDYALQQKTADAYVKFSEIFYRAAMFDRTEKDHRKIKRIVLVDGKKAEDSVVVNEDFQWQRYVEATRSWVGMTTYPIKVLTITNISDLAIPPSDSEIGRPQVRELIKGRSQMMRQREHAVPLRWYDVNAVDLQVADKLRKGKWQDIIPMQGPGDKAIGEVAKSQFPRETFQFDAVAKQDLDDAWSMGGPQQGSEAKPDTTATEVKTMSAALNERLDYERSWVLRFFLQIAEGVGSLMQLFSDNEDFVEVVGQDGVRSLASWNKDTIQGQFVFETKPDSQLRLDVNQKRTEGLNLYKLLRKDPLVNPQGLVQELLELHGLDPSKSMAKPEPPKPPPAKTAFSYKGEDLINPIALAVLQKGGMEITAADIQKAKALIDQAAMPAPVVPGQPVPGQPPGPPPQGPPTGETPPHGGMPPKVDPLGTRYGNKPEDAATTHGSTK